MLPTPSSADSINEIKQMMREGFAGLGTRLDRLDERIRQLETTSSGDRQVQDLKIEQINKALTTIDNRNDAIELRLKLLEKSIEDFQPWTKGMKWLLVTLGGSVMALLWGILTHTVILDFH